MTVYLNPIEYLDTIISVPELHYTVYIMLVSDKGKTAYKAR